MPPLSYSFLFLFLLCFCCASSLSFSFEGFAGSFDQDFVLFGDAGALNATTLAASSGGVLHRKPITFGRNPRFATDLTFSVPKTGNGKGITFFIAPGNGKSNRLALSPGVFAVEFDPNANHVGIDVGSPVSVATFNVSAVNLSLSSGEKFRSWIDFDGDLKSVEVRLSKFNESRPSEPLVSYPIDLLLLGLDSMFVGIASSTQNQMSFVYSWRFAVKSSAPYRMHSDPLDPRAFVKVKPPIITETTYLPVVLMALAFGAACGGGIVFLVFFAWSAPVDRTAVTPVDYSPHPDECCILFLFLFVFLFCFPFLQHDLLAPLVLP